MKSSCACNCAKRIQSRCRRHEDALESIEVGGKFESRWKYGTFQAGVGKISKLLLKLTELGVWLSVAEEAVPLIITNRNLT